MLDIDDSKTFTDVLQRLLDAPGIWDQLQRDVTGDRELFDEFSYAPQYVKTPAVRVLRDRAEQAIRSEYSSVAVYHSCCPLDRKSYTDRGLLVTTQDILLELTHEAFGRSSAIDGAFATVCHEYLQWYNGTVGLWLTAYEDNGHHKGHFLDKMASALGEEGKRLLDAHRRRCRPSIVKCRIPLAWLDHKMRDPSLGHYASAVLQRMILSRAMLKDAKARLGALGLKCDIPPRMILGFLHPSDE